MLLRAKSELVDGASCGLAIHSRMLGQKCTRNSISCVLPILLGACFASQGCSAHCRCCMRFAVVVVVVLLRLSRWKVNTLMETKGSTFARQVISWTDRYFPPPGSPGSYWSGVTVKRCKTHSQKWSHKVHFKRFCDIFVPRFFKRFFQEEHLDLRALLSELVLLIEPERSRHPHYARSLDQL